jgi:geranylgeranyl pyrophosphate synthase
MADVVRTAWHASDLWELPAVHSQHINHTRQSLLARISHTSAGGTLSEYFERGKMLRAFLVFAASASVGGDPEQAVTAAEAIELLHTASLFHDDIIDQASVRRGVVALHERLGVGRALVLGDHLLLLAFGALSEARAYHAAERVLKAMEALNQCARECCQGQFDELCAGRWISEEQYLSIVTGKTAAPFVAAGMIGAVLGGGTPVQVSQISVFARQMGVAFQIDDDLFDLIGESHALGKPAGNSLVHNRPMLPLIYLWRDCSDAVRKELQEASYSRAELVALLEQYGIVDQVRTAQLRHLEMAMRTVEDLEHSGQAEGLYLFAEGAAVRLKRGINGRGIGKAWPGSGGR